MFQFSPARTHIFGAAFAARASADVSAVLAPDPASRRQGAAIDHGGRIAFNAWHGTAATGAFLLEPLLLRVNHVCPNAHWRSFQKAPDRVIY